MAPALTATEYIYEGIWVNWSRGKVLGSTLTSVLRNTSSDLNAIWRFLRLAVAWRHQRDAKVLKSLLPLIIWTSLHLVLVVTVGLLSSWLLEANDEVLSQSPWCGTFDRTYWNQVFANNETNLKAVALMKEYSSYTDSRYATVQQSLDMCQGAAENCKNPRKKSLAWNSSFISDICPIDDSMCQAATKGSMSFDTGFLSSHKDLGYNARSEDRVSIRLTAQCAPLEAADYVTDWQDVPSTSNSQARQVVDAHYGPGRSNKRNSTYSLTKGELECDERVLAQPYSLVPFIALPGGNPKQLSATFTPIPELRPTDRDLTLVLMSFNNVYEDPVVDPWFSAQRKINVSTGFCLSKNTTVYAPDHALAPMSCTQQWQICNNDGLRTPDLENCTPLQGVAQVNSTMYSSFGSTKFTPRQLATTQRLVRAAYASTFYYVIYALSQSTSPPLKARNLISYNVGPALPPTQWQTETQYWMELVLAYFQQANLDYSTGQFAASTSYVNVTHASTANSSAALGQNAAHWLCQSQIIHSSNYRNFNFFALLLTVILCTVIIVVGLTIEDLTGCVRQRNLRYSGSSGKQDMWIANSDLDMLRRVDELKNGSAWSLSRSGVPLTHVSNTVSINDLMSDGNEVEKGTGFVVPAVKREREARNKLRSSPYKHIHDSGHKRCATCSTFEISPSGSRPQISRTGTSTEDEGNGMTFHNTFRRNFVHGVHYDDDVNGSGVPTYTTTSYTALPNSFR
ncbi:hypothetical protein LTS08_007078 [Lithohypha guttulata]|nr:hypothetical protein LTS08_007078 [Lithohypha guttulata]